MTRDERILILYQRGVTRKTIAYRVHSNYEIVKKVIQKYSYQGYERRRYPRPEVIGRVVILAIA